MSDSYDYEQADKAMLEELRRIQRTRDITAEVAAERGRQHKLWGEQNHPLGFGGAGTRAAADDARAECDLFASVGAVSWGDILKEEFSEAMAEDGHAAARKELIQVAAVAVAIIDWIDRGAPE